MKSFESVVYVALLAVILGAHWGIGDRKPGAWLASIGARIGLIVWAAATDAYALAPVTAAFLVVDWRNYRKWKRERLFSNRIADAMMNDPTALDPAESLEEQ